MRQKRYLRFMFPALAILVLGFLATAATAGVVWDGTGDPAASGFVLETNIPGEPDSTWPDPFMFDYCKGLSCPGIMLQNTNHWDPSSASNADYKLADSHVAAEMIRANGWSVETRVQVLSNTVSGNWFGLVMLLGDDVGGMGLLLRPNEIRAYESSWSGYPWSPNALIPIDTDFHDIRVQVAPRLAERRYFCRRHGDTGGDDRLVDQRSCPSQVR